MTMLIRNTFHVAVYNYGHTYCNTNQGLAFVGVRLLSDYLTTLTTIIGDG